MNCETFNSIVFRFARSEESNSDEREAARAHARTCDACAASLAAQENLTRLLGIMRDATREADAPHRLEANLRAAFRRQTSTGTHVAGERLPVAETFAADGAIADGAVDVRAGNVYSFADHAVANSKRATMRSQLQRFTVFIPAAAAATIAIVVAVYALTANREASNSDNRIATSKQMQEKRDPVSREIMSANSDARQVYRGGSGGITMPASAPAIASNNHHNRLRAPEVAKRHRRSDRNPSTQTLNAGSTPDEIATDFMPLVEADALAAMDGGHVVRVELPRQTLVSFGLPMNNDRAHEPVKADVLMGDDGLARAIRFVR